MEKVILDKNAPSSWGPTLKELRQKHKVEQKDLSEDLQVPASYVSRYESSKMYPALSVLARYAIRFNVIFCIE